MLSTLTQPVRALAQRRAAACALPARPFWRQHCATATAERAWAGVPRDTRRRAAAPAVEEVDFSLEDVNSVCLTGNCGDDATLDELSDSRVVSNVDIAVYQGKERPPLWITITGWADAALQMHEVCRRGTQVRVLGQLKMKNWTNKEGHKRFKMIVLASDIATVRRRQEAREVATATAEAA